MRERWQPRIRAQARKQAATSTGLVVDTRTRFGFTAAPDTSDDAQDAGASEQQLRDIAAEGLGEVYFRDGGRRPHGLEVEFTDVSTWSSTCSRNCRTGQTDQQAMVTVRCRSQGWSQRSTRCGAAQHVLHLGMRFP